MTTTTKLPKTYLVADLFCGAGGTSTGARKAIQAIGGEMELVAVNHWQTAVATHRLNHPDARHYVHDLETADPETLVPEGRLDLLMASPECRFYSRAKGGRPTRPQGRMSPWAVQRWLTSLDVRQLLVENVQEFVKWGPLLPNGKPDKDRQGEHFGDWISSLWKLGYRTEWKILNAADFGDATSRVRFFLQARKDGKQITWPQPSHAKVPDPGLAQNLQPWRGAREIIDWSDLGESIFDAPKFRRKPLRVNTRRRIAKGLHKFGGPLADLYVPLLDIPDLQAAPLQREAPESSLNVSFTCANRNANAPRSLEQPVSVITTAPGGGNFFVNAAPKPFILGQQSCSAPRNETQPIPTVCTSGAIAFVRPHIVRYNGTSGAEDVENPLSTIMPIRKHGLVALVVKYYKQSHSADIDLPLSTITTKDRFALAIPSLNCAEQEHPADHTTETATVDPRRLVDIDGALHLLDIRFRMLNNDELARASGFVDGEKPYEFVGNKTQITRQIGNAVPINLAAALVEAALS